VNPVGTLFEIADLVIRKQLSEAHFELIVPRLQIARGEMVALIGPSGCGKSTLLDVLALAAPIASAGRFLFAPREGEVLDVGRLLLRGDLDALARIRRRHIGYVLQTGGLLPFLDVARNIGLLLPRRGVLGSRRVAELAKALGLERHLHKKPAALSAGERQRVAIGRALALRPAAILADEPTAALDPLTSDGVMRLFIEQVRRADTSCLVATHDWDRVERLGLRRLQQRFEPTGRSGWVRSVMQT
jgi:putative ABC transport system ATP-binding protein